MTVAAETPLPAPIAWRRYVRPTAAFVVALLVGLLVHFVVERITERHRVLRRVTALGVPLGGLDEAGARQALSHVAERLAVRRARARLDKRVFDADTQALALSLDVETTLHAALASGRSGSFVAQIGWWLSRLFSDYALPIATRFDVERAHALLATWQTQALPDAVFDGGLVYEGKLLPKYPKEGFRLRTREALQLLVDALCDADKNSTPVALPVERVAPKLERRHVDEALAVAAPLVAAPIVLSTDAGVDVTMDPAALGNALRTRAMTTPSRKLDVYFDSEALGKALEKPRAELERPAQNAKFEVDGANRITIVPSENGRRVDLDRLARDLPAMVTAGRRGKLVVLQDVRPTLSTEQAEALHIKGFVSQFTTYFPCCEARVKNIARIAAIVDGSVMRPGEVFSLNATTGPRTESNGFVSGPTIVEGEVEMTVGGGACQFATTLFNAVFDGGYEIIQRQPHTYYFPRYPMGHEATVSYPTPDLIFRNDTAAGMLIKTQVGDKFVRVMLYGDNGGRRVTRHVSQRFDIVDPPTEFEPNPAMPPDASELKRGGVPGWSVEVDRTITFADGQQKTERRKVTYSPRPRRVEVHPCRIPAGEKGYTGEPCPVPRIPDGGFRESDDTPS